MKTAKNLQLLDSQNNNISPAVGIESLYFEEQTSETDIIRRRLYDKVLLVDNTGGITSSNVTYSATDDNFGLLSTTGTANYNSEGRLKTLTFGRFLISNYNTSIANAINISNPASVVAGLSVGTAAASGSIGKASVNKNTYKVLYKAPIAVDSNNSLYVQTATPESVGVIKVGYNATNGIGSIAYATSAAGTILGKQTITVSIGSSGIATGVVKDTRYISPSFGAVNATIANANNHFIVGVQTNVAAAKAASVGKASVTNASIYFSSTGFTCMPQSTFGSNVSIVGNCTGANFYASSDERWKKNISDVIATVPTPEVKQFDWKKDDKRAYGFIAQELEAKGLTELVETDEAGYKTVNYNSAFALAIAKLTDRVASLEERVKELESK